jgi:hypothetical protein
MMWGGGMGGVALAYGVLWIAVVVLVLMALWRGMLAQEKIARHLETIERHLAQRGASD